MSRRRRVSRAGRVSAGRDNMRIRDIGDSYSVGRGDRHIGDIIGGDRYSFGGDDEPVDAEHEHLFKDGDKTHNYPAQDLKPMFDYIRNNARSQTHINDDRQNHLINSDKHGSLVNTQESLLFGVFNPKLSVERKRIHHVNPGDDNRMDTDSDMLRLRQMYGKNRSAGMVKHVNNQAHKYRFQ